MILGIGIDMVDLPRMKKLWQRWDKRLEKRVLTEQECSLLPAQSAKRLSRIASAFAAKEAFGKALGCGLRAPATLQAIEIVRDKLGMPSYRFAPALDKMLAERNVSCCRLSLCHERRTAAAVAIIECA